MLRAARGTLPALAVALVVAAGPTAAFPQDGAGDPRAALDAERIDSLIATLESDEERRSFIDGLKALAQTRREMAPPPDGAAAGETGALERGLSDLIHELGDGGAVTAWLAGQASDGDLRALWLQTLWQVALSLGCGIAAMLLVGRLTARRLETLRERDAASWMERPLIALGGLALRAVPVAAFAAVAYPTMLAVAHDDLSRTVSAAAVNAVALTQIAVSAVRTILAPLSPQVRALPIDDRQAAYLTVWFRRFATVGIYGFLATDLLATLGAPGSGVALLQRAVGLALTLMAVIVILQCREATAAWIRAHPAGGGGRMARHRLADIWHVLAMVAVAVLFAVWALRVGDGFAFLLRGFATTGVAVFGALLVSALAGRLLGRLFRVGGDLSDRFPGLERRTGRYVSLAGWLLNAVVWLSALAVALEAWGVEAVSLATSPSGLEVLGRLAAVVIIAAVAVAVWELGDGAISSYLRRREEDALSPRLSTLLPLVRNGLMVAVGVIATITILAEIGLDIAPLLAGAGVIGLAIGFGAQTLVKDVITGAFILFEDQFSVGDWIDAGGKMGGVESISIRTVRLRDIDGYVHTVPFGEIATLTNMMRDFGYAVIDIGVAYRENTDKVIEVIREVDAEARGNPDLAERLSGDLEVLGVNALGDSSVTVRVRIKTPAGFQWGVRREYLRLIKLRFDEAGIEIPFPHMTVYFGEIRGGTTAPAIVRLDAGDPEPASGPAA